MTPDKTLLTDSLSLLVILFVIGALSSALCSDPQTPQAAAIVVDPVELCAEELGLLHPRHAAILVHGSPRREAVSPALARWYCRKVTPKGASKAIQELRPLTAEEVATW